jgi:hypothetical protein
VELATVVNVQVVAEDLDYFSNQVFIFHVAESDELGLFEHFGERLLLGLGGRLELLRLLLLTRCVASALIQVGCLSGGFVCMLKAC